MTFKTRICLWFEKGGLGAAQFYTTLLPNSSVEAVDWPGDSEPIIVNFTLAGTPYQILNGGPHFKLTPAASISVVTQDQAETDHLWTALTADGGSESQCGWLTDRWGVSWQIVPEALITMQTNADQVAAERARQAMYQMTKIDIATLQAAFAG
ncbi:MAG: VOC family protein [Pseudomonadota bacterium]